MKKIIKIFIFIILLSLGNLSFAQIPKEYNLLEPLPGFEEAVTPSNPVTYIEALYWYALGLAVVLSVLMLVIGGLEYTTSFASESNKGKAKARIENALIGLVIALTSYLILYTVNPEMATLKLKDIKEACALSGGGGSQRLPAEAPISGTADGNGNGNLQLEGTGPTSERYYTDSGTPSSGADLQLDNPTQTNDFQLEFRNL